MEEVWKDIHQTPIQDPNQRTARGFFEDARIRGGVPAEDGEEVVTGGDSKAGLFKKELLMIGAPGFISSLDSHSPFESLATNTVVAASTSPASLLNSSCFPIAAHNKRPLPECHHDMLDSEPGVDRRHKRMLKNRESAARSRARRQAYTSELEREHEELKQENAMLRKQQEQLLLSAPAQVVPKKPTHNRSFTAPF